MPNSWAMAGMCSRELVEPEMAAWTMTAFSKDSRVTMSRGFRPSFASSMTCCPAFLATLRRSSQVAGIRAEPGSIRPRASPMTCMVEAVPMKEQTPQEGQACCLYQVSFSSVISPRLHWAA